MATKLAELLPVLHDLPRADKLRAIQYLSADLVEEGGHALVEGSEYPVWSPWNAGAAAATLERELQRDARMRFRDDSAARQA